MTDYPIFTGTAHIKEEGIIQGTIPEVEIMGSSWNSTHYSH